MQVIFYILIPLAFLAGTIGVLRFYRWHVPKSRLDASELLRGQTRLIAEALKDKARK